MVQVENPYCDPRGLVQSASYLLLHMHLTPYFSALTASISVGLWVPSSSCPNSFFWLCNVYFMPQLKSLFPEAFHDSNKLGLVLPHALRAPCLSSIFFVTTITVLNYLSNICKFHEGRTIVLLTTVSLVSSTKQEFNRYSLNECYFPPFWHIYTIYCF